MATYKVLGQVYPSATANTTLYTVPSAKSAVVSTINICNRASAGDTISVMVRPAAETLADKHYVLSNEPLGPNSSMALTLGITLATTDVVTVYSLNGTSAFNAFGSEI